MKQSRLVRKAKNLVKRVYQWRSPLGRKTRSPKARFQRSLIFAALLFVLSMAVPSVVAQVPESTPIVQSQLDPLGLIEKAKKLYETGDLEEAEADLQQAAKAFAASGDRLNQEMALSNLSLIYQKQGKWELAKQVINESLELLETQPKTKERSRILAQTLDIQGQLQRELGQPEEALETWQKAADLYTQIENKDGETQSQINQVLALQDLGLYPRACNTLLAVLELKIENCKELSKLSQQDLTEKLQVLGKQPVSSSQLQGLRNLSEVLRVMGQPIQSEIVLTESLNLANQLETSPAKEAEIAAIHFSLGNIARLQKDFKDAKKAAMEHYIKADTKSARATIRLQSKLNQLSLLVASQEWSEVKSLWSKIDLALKEFPASRTKIYAQINLAQSLMCSIKPALDKDLELSSPLLQQCGSPEAEAKSTNNKGLDPSLQDSWEPTIKRIEQIRQIVINASNGASFIGDKKAEAYALGYLGGADQQLWNVYQQMEKLSEEQQEDRNKKLSEAKKYTKQALNFASTFSAPDVAYLWEWQLGRLLKAEAAQAQKEKPVAEEREILERAIAAYKVAFESLKSLRGDLVAINPEIRFNFRDSLEPFYREYVDLLLPSENRSQDEIWHFRENPNQEKLKLAREAIEALQLAELNDFFRDACIEAKPEKIDEVIEKTESPTAFLYAIILKDRIEVILSLSGKTELQSYYTEIPQNEVKKTLSNLRRNLSIPHRVSKVKELSQKVYDWLIRPAQDNLTKEKLTTLVFVLDSELRSIPLAVLYDAKTKQYLVEKYAIALTPGLQLLSPQPLAKLQLTALPAGVSEARQIGSDYFPAIPDVQNELIQVQSTIPNSSKPLLNQEFIKKQLQIQIDTGNFNIVHLSTHGEFSADPEKTFLLTWDRRLKVQELENIVRIKRVNQSIPIELLVLSACETAEGDERAALGMAGVAVRAGARSTLATLWPVYGESTAKFMHLFYKKLVEVKRAENLTKAEALRQVQLDFLAKREPGELWYRPYFWAPFILLGNWL